MICPFCKNKIILEELKIRSLPQNKYYWGCPIKILSDYLGFTQSEIHEILKWKFLSSKVMKSMKGKMIELTYVKSTTDLTTIEFEDYLSQIRIWASADLGCWIPEPNELETEYNEESNIDIS